MMDSLLHREMIEKRRAINAPLFSFKRCQGWQSAFLFV